MCTLWLAESSTISMHVLVFRRELEEEEEERPPPPLPNDDGGNHMLSEQWCTLNSRYRYGLAPKQLLIILTSDVIIFSCNDNIIDLNFTAPACMGPSHGDGGEIIIYIYSRSKVQVMNPNIPRIQPTYFPFFFFSLLSGKYRVWGAGSLCEQQKKIGPNT